jgi:hypothetical protein
MAKIQTFEGGKSTRLAPHLIGINSGVQYKNIDNESGMLTPVMSEAEVGVALYEYAQYFEAESVWISSATDTDYLEYQKRMYAADGVGVPTWTKGGVTSALGILAPAAAPSVASAAGVLTGTYQYVYTYYSSVSGAESAPSPVSAEIVLATNSVNLTSLVVSTDPQVDKIRVYRVGGTILSFSLVATITPATSYADNIADSAIPGNPITTEASGQALAGGRDIKEAYAMLFYTLGEKLYFSAVGKWYSYPPLNFIDFGKDITGYGFVSSGIIVFTKQRAYLITGNSPTSFNKSNLSGSDGCQSYRSVQQMSNAILWVSQDGLCMSSGGKPTIISRPVLGDLNLQVVNAVVHKDVYYAQLVDGSTFCFDARFGAMFKDLSLGTTRLIVALNKLYGYFSSEYRQLFAGPTPLALTYESPVFLDGSYTKRKGYNSIYIRYEGELAISVLIDGKIVTNITVTGSDTYELDVNQDEQDGYSLQFLISGTGTVKEIDYQATGSARL